MSNRQSEKKSITGRVRKIREIHTAEGMINAEKENISVNHVGAVRAVDCVR